MLEVVSGMPKRQAVWTTLLDAAKVGATSVLPPLILVPER